MQTPTPAPSCAIETAVVDGAVGVAELDWPGDCGGECVFLGRTRHETHAEHGALKYLSYEVFEPMAEQLMRRMCLDAAAQFGCRAVRMVHAKGRVDPGRASVVIQVATPHRGEAFAACRYLIDRLKHELPIWKTEVWERGRTRVEGCCVHQESTADPGGRTSG